MRNKFFSLAALSFLLPAAIGQSSPQVQEGNDPSARLDNYIRHTASQKIYLHFNKHKFTAGDIIWFNAYLVNAITHEPDTAKTNIYIDLIHSDGTIMERRLLMAENGSAEGDISLPLTIPDGNYRIRAYTDWMRNFDEEFYFNHYLYINNPSYAGMIPRSDIRSNRRFNRDLGRMAEEYQVAFFPEGGDLVSGVLNRVAFKVADNLGRGLDAEGVVTDQNGNEVASLNTLHDGMGSFEFLPENGATYRASVAVNGNRARTFDLPSPRQGGVALRVSRDNDNIIVRLSSSNPGNVGEVLLLAHTRGDVKYSDRLKMTSGTADVVMPVENFPSGITHVTVFSANGNPLAERLVFINRNDQLVFTPRLFRVSHEGEEYLGLQMEITDTTGRKAEGNFSVSVVDGDFQAPGSIGTLLSNFLLTSDLEGIISNPQDYLDPEKEMESELDLLMMTHGWRRFSWGTVMEGQLPATPHAPMASLSIRGRITDPAKDDPVNNHQVRLRVMGEKDEFYTVRSGNRGYFEFEDLMYHDNFRVEIGSPRLHGDYPPKIELMTEGYSGYDYRPNLYTREEQITSRGSDWRRVREAGRSPYEEEVVPGGRTQQRFGVPDQTIFIDREKVTHRTVYDVLVERAVGLQVQGGTMMFRGPTSINLSSEPMFMLDGVQTSKDVVLNQNPREIERIEIFRGTSSAMFGVRGASGVIIAYQRQAGDHGFQDSKEYMIVGYHSPREFFSDMITSSRGGSGEQVRALHWQPVFQGGDDEDNTIFFPISSLSGMMKIVVEGTSYDGQLGTGIFTVQLR